MHKHANMECLQTRGPWVGISRTHGSCFIHKIITIEIKQHIKVFFLILYQENHGINVYF